MADDYSLARIADAVERLAARGNVATALVELIEYPGGGVTLYPSFFILAIRPYYGDLHLVTVKTDTNLSGLAITVSNGPAVIARMNELAGSPVTASPLAKRPRDTECIRCDGRGFDGVTDGVPRICADCRGTRRMSLVGLLASAIRQLDMHSAPPDEARMLRATLESAAALARELAAS